MFLIALALMLLGSFAALLGLKLFRALLPLIGFFAGIMVGFGGVQGVFGTGVVSTTVAIVMALVVGIIMALLSFLFFEIAVFIVSAMIGATALSYLGVVLGLGDNGFLMALLAIAGAILGFMLASRSTFSTSLVIALTSFAGVSFIFAGIMLLVGDISLDEIHEDGIIPSVLNVVDDAFLWFIAWIGGSVIAMNIQVKTLMLDVLGNELAFEEKKTKA